MKKMFKAAVLLAAAMMVMGFVSCSDSDNSDDTVLPAQESGGGETSGGSDEKSDGGKSDVETPSLSTYILDVTNIPEVTGAEKEIDSTVTVVSTRIGEKDGKSKTIKTSNKKYIQMTGGSVGNDYVLKLTVSGAATIKVKATKKTSAGKATCVKLVNSDGKTEVGKTEGIDNDDTS